VTLGLAMHLSVVYPPMGSRPT